MKQIQEDYIQQQAYIWLTNNYGLKHHTPRLIMYSVANEIGASVSGALAREFKIYTGPKSKFQKVVTKVHGDYKNTGLKKGVADTHILFPNGKIIFVEFKTPTGTQRPEQKEFQLQVEALGFKYYIVRSVEQFKEIIKSEL